MGSGQPFQVYFETLYLTALLLRLIILQQLESASPFPAWVPSHMPVLVWTLFILLRVEEETLLVFILLEASQIQPLLSATLTELGQPAKLPAYEQLLIEYNYA